VKGKELFTEEKGIRRIKEEILEEI